MTTTERRPSGGLGRSATRGALVTIVGQGMRMLVQLAGIVLLARLLAPTDYGLTAMVAVVIGLGELFRDFGLSSAAIQAPTLSRQQQSNLFWANTGIGVVLALVVCLTSPLLAGFFHDDRLVLLTMSMSLIFVFNGLSTQYRANLARSLRFLPLTSTELAGQAGGLLVGLAMALTGFGYWSLAGQQVAQAVFTLVGLLVATRWRPSLPSRKVSIRPFVGYGSNLLGTQLLNYLTRNTDNIVIGAAFGAFSLGVYSRAYQLVMMPLAQLQAPSTRVALSVLSRLQDDRERFSEYILLGQVAMLTVVGALFAFLAAQAPAVVAVALGEQWAAAVPLFQILLIAGFFQSASYASYWVFLAKGLTRSNLWFAAATRPAMAVVLLLGAFWGPTGVAWGLAAGTALAWPVGLLWIGRVSDAPVGRMLQNGLRSLAVFGAATAVGWLATAWLPVGDVAARLGVGLVADLATAALAALLWPSFRRDLRGIASLRRHLARRKRVAA